MKRWIIASLLAMSSPIQAEPVEFTYFANVINPTDGSEGGTLSAVLRHDYVGFIGDGTTHLSITRTFGSDTYHFTSTEQLAFLIIDYFEVEPPEDDGVSFSTSFAGPSNEILSFGAFWSGPFSFLDQDKAIDIALEFDWEFDPVGRYLRISQPQITKKDLTSVVPEPASLALLGLGLGLLVARKQVGGKKD